MMLMTNITLLTNMKNQSQRNVKIQVRREDPQKSREKTLIIEEKKMRQVTYVDSMLKRKISKILLEHKITVNLHQNIMNHKICLWEN